MGLLLLIVILFLVFGGGGGYWGYRRVPEAGPGFGWNARWGFGGFGLILFILLILYLFGGIHLRF
jgi:hypothetical protein